MNQLFNYDNPVWIFVGKFFDILFVGILWLLCCVPVLTIGASTCAMLTVTMKIARKEDPGVFMTFFRAFKTNFKKGTILWLIMLAAGIMIASAFYFWSKIEGNFRIISLGITGCFTLIYLMVFLYVFAMQAYFENTVKMIILNSFYTAMSNWATTLVLAIAFIGVLALCYIYPIVLMIMMIGGSGLVALGFSLLYVRAFQKLAEISEKNLSRSVSDSNSSESEMGHLDNENELAGSVGAALNESDENDMETLPEKSIQDQSNGSDNKELPIK